ncbi:Protein CBG25522 [Caenorhabditis briggsae]|uniref:Protein CBG25522 n=1 Tax=Caenorhabditis briggsae TaxID=6238 RepID=B6IFP7_CAEBR|nr:Protein CBG25522 [Caenorhabditis briggsae]CAR98727.1 Protein CBG25522 [Caenorhabditis briggsae]
MNTDFSQPEWLIIHYHVMGVISIILNFFGIYLLLVHCKNLSKFRYFLLVYQVICLITDIHLNFLWQPVPLYPILAGYSLGYLANWIPFHYSMLIVSVLAIFQLNFLVICFMKRHQAVALVLETHRFPETLTKSFYIFSYFFPIIFGALFEILKMTEDEQWDHIRKV